VIAALAAGSAVQWSEGASAAGAPAPAGVTLR
jgi:hypothetical protein